MNCPNCGAEITSNTKFCPYCGSKLVNDNNFTNQDNTKINLLDSENVLLLVTIILTAIGFFSSGICSIAGLICGIIGSKQEINKNKLSYYKICNIINIVMIVIGLFLLIFVFSHFINVWNHF